MNFDTPCSSSSTASGKMRKKEKNHQHIQVYVRVRPLNTLEKARASTVVMDCSGHKEVVLRGANNVSRTFTFDRVFGPNSEQLEVYKTVVAPLLEQVLLGYNCTVFAYGQTSTGKTYTMEGERSTDKQYTWDTDPFSGILPRAMSQLFDELNGQDVEFTVRVSLLELYNEELFDLLQAPDDPKGRNLKLFEDSAKNLCIQGLEEIIVHNKHEVYAIMERGSLRRQTAATQMNATSSRSHTVFTVTVHIKECTIEGEEMVKIGKLHLVDLAGSENIGRSGAVDMRAREAGSINQSLLTLGRVITSLVDRAPHVPYRESKLTRILQDSLGGRTKTSIIATVSPASINLEETQSTLEYAHRAKNIQNRPEVNQKMTKKAMIKAYTEEIERLRRDLQATREKNGVFMSKETYNQMTAQLNMQDHELSETLAAHNLLHAEVNQLKIALETANAVSEDQKEQLTAANTVIAGQDAAMKALRQSLAHVTADRDGMKHVVTKYSVTEQQLQDKGKTLIATADSATNAIRSLYLKLQRKAAVEEANAKACKHFHEMHGSTLSDWNTDIDTLRKSMASQCGTERLALQDFTELEKRNLQIDKKFVEELKSSVKGNFDRMLEEIQREWDAHLLGKIEAHEKRLTAVNDYGDGLAQIMDTCSQWSELKQEEIHLAADQLDEFYDDYKVDKPTGSTPQKQVYSYPRVLPKTSPVDSILRDFRQNNSRGRLLQDEESDSDSPLSKYDEGIRASPRRRVRTPLFNTSIKEEDQENFREMNESDD